MTGKFPRSAFLCILRNMHTYADVFVTKKLPSDILEKMSKVGITYEVWPDDKVIPNDKLLECVHGKKGLLCLLTEKINESLVKAAGSQLKIVSTMSVGYDHVDTKCLKEHGIKLGHTPDILTDATAELTLALLLATVRRLMEAEKAVRNGGWGHWHPFWMCGSGLLNRTVGIVGLGRIGMAVAQRLIPFRVKEILYYNRSGKLGDSIQIQDSSPSLSNAFWRSWSDLLAQSDVVICCCSLNPDSKRLFDAQAFSLMKQNAVFVNTSRGGIVDQDALYSALKSKTITAAGLDVTDPEPLPTNHPLLELPNCIILPHIGSATEDTRRAMAELAVDNVIAGLQGHPLPAEVNL